jgi:hypothetical protein
VFRIVSPSRSAHIPQTPPALALPTRLLSKEDSCNTEGEASAATNNIPLEPTTLPISLDLDPLLAKDVNLDFHGTKQHLESRLDHSTPTQKIHSPPPSPRSSLLLSKARDAEFPAAYTSTDTPPASRRASSPDILDGEQSNHDKGIVGDSPTTNPFLVNVPYIKPPLFIDYGTNLHIAASTFINRNFTVLDSPIARVSIGERCLIGPNTTLASITHPLSKFSFNVDPASCCPSSLQVQDGQVEFSNHARWISIIRHP